MNRLIALLLAALPLPALAEKCDHWTAAMQEDEGGSVMTANVCTANGKSYLSVTCGAPGQLSIRYLADGFVPVTDGFTTDLEFNLDQEMFTRKAQYEEMDGALATEVEIGSPFQNVVEHQKKMTVIDNSGKIADATFSLTGSKAALAKVVATCSNQ